MKRFASILIVILALAARASAQAGVGSGGVNWLGLVGGSPAAGYTPIIVVAGSDAPQIVKTMAGSNFTASGTNDEVVLQNAVAYADTAYPAGWCLMPVGTFNDAQMVRVTGSNKTVWAYYANWPIPAVWNNGGRAVWQLGSNHIAPIGTCSGSPGTATFTQGSGGFGFFNNDSGYLSSAGYPGGVTNAIKYFVVNYTATGFGAGTCQLATSQGGSPITVSSNGSGGLAMYTYMGTLDNSNNVITTTDAALTAIPNGTGVVFDLSTGVGPPKWQPFYLKNNATPTTHSYAIYNDPGLLNRYTIASGANGQVLGVQPISKGLKMFGGSYVVANGTNAYGVGLVKDNLTSTGATVQDVYFDFSQDTSEGNASTGLYLGGYGSVAKNIRSIGAATGIQAENAKQLVQGCYLTGGKGIGINVTGNSTISIGTKAIGNEISNFAQQGIKISGGANNSVIAFNSLSNNCTTSQAVNQHIWDAGIGTIISNNVFDSSQGNAAGLNNTGVIASNDIATLDITGTVLTVTPLNDGMFRIDGYCNITNGNSVVNITTTYTDENGTAHTAHTTGQISAGTQSANMGPTNDAYSFIPITIRNKGTNAITVTATLASGTGDFDVGATITQTH